MPEKEVTKKIETETESKDETEVVTPKKKVNTRKKLKQIDRNEMIPCRSVTNGRLTYVSIHTGLMTVWNDFGAIEYVEYGELLTMRASQPKFLGKPWIIIEDSDVIDTMPGLKEMYDNIAKVGEDLDSFFKKSPAEFESILAKLPNGTKGVIAFKAREMVEEGTLYDLRIINIIDKYMHTGLKEFIK